MAKMGRPKVDKPKSKNITVRIDEETYNELNKYCKTNNTNISKLVLGFVNTILGKK